MKKESGIEWLLVDGAKKLGGRAYKFISPGNAGVPDRIVILPGRAPIFVELKTDTGRLTRLQEIQIKYLKKLKQNVVICRGEDGVRTLLEELSYRGGGVYGI